MSAILNFVKICNVLRKMSGLVCFVCLCAYPSGLVCCGLLVVPVVIVGDFKFHVRRQCLLIRSVNFRTTRKTTYHRRMRNIRAAGVQWLSVFVPSLSSDSVCDGAVKCRAARYEAAIVVAVSQNCFIRSRQIWRKPWPAGKTEVIHLGI